MPCIKLTAFHKFICQWLLLLSSGAFGLLTIRMIIKCVSVLCLLCLSVIIFQDLVVSLPFSNDVDLLSTAPHTKVQERSNVTELTKMSIETGHGGLLQNNESEIDLRAALCPWYTWDSDVKCTDSWGVFLSIGHCLTYESGKGAYEFAYALKCPYFLLEGHQVSDFEPGYISLPNNISELNDYMCGPMNRKGFLCEECIDGFSIAMTSLGHRCSNCTDVW